MSDTMDAKELVGIWKVRNNNKKCRKVVIF